MGDYEEFRDYAQLVFGQSRVITIPRFLVEYFKSYQKAIIFNQMLFWSSVKKGDWFYKTYSEWEEEIAVRETAMRGVVNEFKERGYVETKLKKVNGAPVLHYRLIWKVIHDDMSEYFKSRRLESICEDSRMDPAGGVGSIPVDPRDAYIGHKSTSIRQERGSGDPAPQVPPEDTSHTSNGKKTSRSGAFQGMGPEPDALEDSIRLLHHSLSQKGWISRKFNLAIWMKDARAIIRKEEIPESELVGMIQWYCANIGKPFVPEIYSVKTLRDKYYNLKRAKERSDPKSQGDSDRFRQIAEEMNDD